MPTKRRDSIFLPALAVRVCKSFASMYIFLEVQTNMGYLLYDESYR